jgi:hypothetical protein
LKKYDDDEPADEKGEVEPADIVPRVEGAEE